MSSVVPEGWETKRLGDNAYIKARIGWRGLSSSEYTDLGPYLIAGKHLKKGKIQWSECDHISIERFDESPEIQLLENDVVISKDGTIGRLGFVNNLPGPATINGTMMLIRPNSNLFAKFVYYYLEGDKFSKLITEKVSGSSVPHIFQRDMVEFPVDCPPLPEQKKIASILTSVDKVIENTQKQIDKLQDLKKATINELLTKGIGHTEFKDSKLGRIPKSWEVVTLESVSSFRRGSFPQPYGNPEWYDDNGIPFVQVFDIGSDRQLKTSTKVKISKKAEDMSVFIPTGSLLVSLQGSIGRVAVTQYDAYVDRTVLIFSKYESSLERFFFSVIIEELFRRQKEVADGGIIKTITKETLKSFEIKVPPLSEQRKIGLTIQSIEHSIAKQENKLQQTQSLKKSLMQDLLTGKVRVTVN